MNSSEKNTSKNNIFENEILAKRASDIVQWDDALIQKYNLSGPRYTSYPTALEFNEAFDFQAWESSLEKAEIKKLSIYVHIPFCAVLCYFCGCNKVVTRNKDKALEYLQFLKREIVFYASFFKEHKVHQLHFGGGSPNFLNAESFKSLMSILKTKYDFDENAEISIELDPRTTSIDSLNSLIDIGFNRISMGVQDFNPKVQKSVNRDQNKDLTHELVAQARSNGINSINLDLIYGLPHQSLQSFDKTLNEIIAINPDRLSVFNYAHIPSMFPSQKLIEEDDLPSPATKLAILQHTIAKLTGAGYNFIGMDHFAKSTDELSIEQKAGRLHRNFQGYTTGGDYDMMGFGVSAISQIGASYSQNYKTLEQYYASIDKNEFALWRGVTLSNDDILRKDIIRELICNFRLDIAQIETNFGIDFLQYFTNEIIALDPLIADELLSADYSAKLLEVLPKGRLLIRTICMIFDRYMQESIARKRAFSKVI